MTTARRPPIRLLAAPLVVLAVMVSAGLLRARLDQPAAPVVAPSSPSPASTPATPAASSIRASSIRVPMVTPKPRTDLVRLVGPVPPRGSGKFGYAAGRSRVLGSKGPVRRFQVAVERGAGEDVTAFAAQVVKVLGDRRSWIGSGRVRLRRVGPADTHDFRIFLATRETAGRMCRRGGIDIRSGAHPYTSCRTTGKVIINLDRWRLSAAPYLRAKVPLAVYRQYVINHEVGHELGQGHQGCPKRGRPAPVMVQQTLSVRGCVPYAWPRRGNRPLSGPGL
jgi:hypothetical protein